MSHTKQASKNGATAEKLGRKKYEKELARLQGELVRLQEWVVREGAKVCIVFEGRDTAGKGGVIKRITERVSRRVFRVVALPAPTDREKSQMYIQRYLAHFPAAGEVVIFDRSWYNRAGAERVMGFCAEDEALRLPEREKRNGYREPDQSQLYIRAKYLSRGKMTHQTLCGRNVRHVHGGRGYPHVWVMRQRGLVATGHEDRILTDRLSLTVTSANTSAQDHAARPAFAPTRSAIHWRGTGRWLPEDRVRVPVC